MNRRTIIARVFAGGIAVALPSGAVAAAIAPQSEPEPISIAPGVDVLDYPEDGWLGSDWAAWYQRTMAESFPRWSAVEVNAKESFATIDTPDTRVSVSVNSGEQNETMVVFISHGPIVDAPGLKVALMGFMMAQASASARASELAR